MTSRSSIERTTETHANLIEVRVIFNSHYQENEKLFRIIDKPFNNDSH